jgi:hypothetical protein
MEWQKEYLILFEAIIFQEHNSITDLSFFFFILSFQTHHRRHHISLAVLQRTVLLKQNMATNDSINLQLASRFSVWRQVQAPLFTAKC